MFDRFTNYDDEVRDLVLDFERTVMRGESQFFDVDELEMIIDYYLEVDDREPLVRAIVYAEDLYPDSTEIKLRRAHWYITNRKFDRALEILQSLEEREPENTDIAYSLGVLYSEMGNGERAIDYYLMAATDGWQTGRIYDNIAEEYHKMKRYDDAIEYYLKALASDGYDEEILYNYLDTSEQADQVEQAATFLSGYAHEHPYSKIAWYCLGCTYFDMGLYDRAEEALELALAIDKRFERAYTELARVQESTGRVGDAASTLLRTIEFAVEPSLVYCDLGQLYYRQGNLPTAMSYYRKSLDLNRSNPYAHAGISLCYLQEGDIAMASASAERALSIIPNNPDALYCSAMLADAKGDTERAYELMDELIASPFCLEYHCRCYVFFFFGHQDYNMVEPFIEDSLQYMPHDPFYSTYLAAIYFRTNRYNRLRRVLTDVDPQMLHNICPEMWLNPHLAPLLPSPDGGSTEHDA